MVETYVEIPEMQMHVSGKFAREQENRAGSLFSGKTPLISGILAYTYTDRANQGEAPLTKDRTMSTKTAFFIQNSHTSRATVRDVTLPETVSSSSLRGAIAIARRTLGLVPGCEFFAVERATGIGCHFIA